MSLKIQAHKRLSAMAITVGDNFDGSNSSLTFLKFYADRFKVLTSHEDFAFLYIDTPFYHNYLLVKLSVPINEFKTNLEGDKYLKNTGVSQILGWLRLDPPYSNETKKYGLSVYTSWIDKSLRGMGYGKALYTAVHHYSKYGISSSDDLGTYSLAVWLSLYKSNPKIKLCYEHKGNVVSRNKVRIIGMKLFVKIENEFIDITTDYTYPFYFVWKK